MLTANRLQALIEQKYTNGPDREESIRVTNRNGHRWIEIWISIHLCSASEWWPYSLQILLYGPIKTNDNKKRHSFPSNRVRPDLIKLSGDKWYVALMGFQLIRLWDCKVKIEMQDNIFQLLMEIPACSIWIQWVLRYRSYGESWIGEEIDEKRVWSPYDRLGGKWLAQNPWVTMGCQCCKGFLLLALKSELCKGLEIASCQLGDVPSIPAHVLRMHPPSPSQGPPSQCPPTYLQLTAPAWHSDQPPHPDSRWSPLSIQIQKLKLHLISTPNQGFSITPFLLPFYIYFI